MNEAVSRGMLLEITVGCSQSISISAISVPGDKSTLAVRDGILNDPAGEVETHPSPDKDIFPLLPLDCMSGIGKSRAKDRESLAACSSRSPSSNPRYSVGRVITGEDAPDGVSHWTSGDLSSEAMFRINRPRMPKSNILATGV